MSALCPVHATGSELRFQWRVCITILLLENVDPLVHECTEALDQLHGARVVIQCKLCDIMSAMKKKIR